DEGEIIFKGEKLNNSHIKYIGYLPEERGLYKKIKVMRQLEYFARLRGLNDKQATERAKFWLEKMKLYDVRHKKIEELSKGMQQKIQFIVAVINNPELLILDEPFSGFDPVNAELLTEVILELKNNGTTIIFSTHRMESVEQLCDYMALINLSEKILDGKVTDIKQQFRSDKYVVVTEKPVNFNLSGIELLNESTTDSGYPNYQIKLSGITSNDCLKHLLNQSEIVSFSRYMPSIHDIFIQSVS
ncbi:MAG TPA: ATP-binding cassette domain-containing protein, partial [Bacteroidia bacterium]